MLKTVTKYTECVLNNEHRHFADNIFTERFDFGSLVLLFPKNFKLFAF